MTPFISKAMRNYLDAIGEVYGTEYRNNMVVRFDGSHYVFVKHPDAIEGETVPLGHLEMMTRSLLAQSAMRRAS